VVGPSRSSDTVTVMQASLAPSANNRCPASFATLTTQYTARVASRVGHLETLREAAALVVIASARPVKLPRPSPRTSALFRAAAV
jgi:hypothetical protein